MKSLNGSYALVGAGGQVHKALPSSPGRMLRFHVKHGKMHQQIVSFFSPALCISFNFSSRPPFLLRPSDDLPTL